MAGNNTPAAVIWYTVHVRLSFGVCRVAELLQFEISQYIIFFC